MTVKKRINYNVEWYPIVEISIKNRILSIKNKYKDLWNYDPISDTKEKISKRIVKVIINHW